MGPGRWEWGLGRSGPRRLSPGAQLVIDQLTAPGSDPDEILTVALPHGMTAAERQHEINTHQAVVAELRAAGYAIEAERYGAPNGEILTIGPRLPAAFAAAWAAHAA